MAISKAQNTYKICDRIDILNAAILPSQDNSFFKMYFHWVSSLAIKGVMLVLTRDDVEVVRVIPRYGMSWLLHV